MRTPMLSWQMVMPSVLIPRGSQVNFTNNCQWRTLLLPQ